MELSAQQRTISYAMLVPLWAVIFVNFILPFENHAVQQGLFWGGIVMSAVHLVEVFLFFPKLPASTNKVLGIVLIFLFGIVYASSFPKGDGGK